MHFAQSGSMPSGQKDASGITEGPQLFFEGRKGKGSPCLLDQRRRIPYALHVMTPKTGSRRIDLFSPHSSLFSLVSMLAHASTTVPNIRPHSPMIVCQCQDQSLDQDAMEHPSPSSGSSFSIMDFRINLDRDTANLVSNDSNTAYAEQWRALCRSSNWTTVYLPPQQSPTIPSPEQRVALLSNAGSIRHLSISNTGSVLADFSCTNLTHLTSRGSPPTSGRDSDEHNTSKMNC